MYPGNGIGGPLSLQPAVAKTEHEANEEKHKASPDKTNPMVFRRTKRKLQEIPMKISFPHIAVFPFSEYHQPKVVYLGEGVHTWLAQVCLRWGGLVQGLLSLGCVVDGSPSIWLFGGSHQRYADKVQIRSFQKGTSHASFNYLSFYELVDVRIVAIT